MGGGMHGVVSGVLVEVFIERGHFGDAEWREGYGSKSSLSLFMRLLSDYYIQPIQKSLKMKFKP